MTHLSGSVERSLLHVIGSLKIGGTERHLARIAPRLHLLGWRVSIFTLTEPGPLAGPLEDQGIAVSTPPLPGWLRRAGRWARPLRMAVVLAVLIVHLLRRQPRIVHYWLPHSYVIGMSGTLMARAFAPWSRGLRVRVMSRRSLNLYKRTSWALRHTESRLHRFCTAVLGNSRAVTAELEAEGVAPDRLHLIYNGVETAETAPPDSPAGRRAARLALGLPPDAVVLTKLANLIPYKGHADLLVAFAEARRRSSARLALCLVGRDDGIGPALQAQAAGLGISEDVLFLGPRSDVFSILASSDVAVMSSHEEGFSNAILEAMSAGLPVVATCVGGNAEAVLDGETGLVVPPRDPRAMADALVQLIDDPPLRRRCGEAGRRRVRAEFDLDACVRRYDSLYAGLLTPPRSRSASDGRGGRSGKPTTHS